MKKKRLALFMAVAMTITSLPVGSITGYAEEGEDIILSDEFPVSAGEAGTSDELTLDGVTVVEESGGEVPLESEFTDLQETETYETAAPEPETTLATEEMAVTEAAVPDGETELVAEPLLLAEDLVVEGMETVEDPKLDAVELLSDTDLEIPSEAVTLVPGQEVTAEFPAGEQVWYTYTSQETANYIIGSKDNTVDTEVWLYQVQDGVLQLVSSNDDGGTYGNMNFYLSAVLNADVTYYYAVGSHSSGTAGSCTVYFEKSENAYVTDLVISSQPSRTSFISDFESIGDCASDMSFTATYSDGTSGTLYANNSRDAYGNAITRTLYMKDGDQKGAAISDFSGLSGPYLLEVSCGTAAYTTEVTFRTLQEAAGENVLTEDSDLTMPTGYAGAAWFTPGAAGNYYFQMTNYSSMSIYSETGNYISRSYLINGIKASLESNTRYIVAYRTYSDTTAPVLSVKNMKELVDFAPGANAATTFSAFSLYDEIKNYPVNATYESDTEPVKWTDSGYNDGLSGYTENGDGFVISLMDSDGSEVPFSYGLVPTGTYTLRVYLQSDSEQKIERMVSVTADYPQGTVTLTNGVSNDSSFVVLAKDKERLYYRFSSEETAKYSIKCSVTLDSEGYPIGYWPNTIYEIDTDGTITELEYEYDYPTLELTQGKTYLFEYIISNYGASEESGSVSMTITQQGKVTGITVPAEVTYSFVDAAREMADFQANVAFTDGSQTVSGWWSTTRDNVRVRAANLNNEETIYMTLLDSERNKISIPDEEENEILNPGNYTLHFEAGDQTADCAVTVTGVPESATKVNVGGSAEYDTYSTTQYFVFQPETDGNYIIKYTGYPGHGFYQINESGIQVVENTGRTTTIAMKQGETYVLALWTDEDYEEGTVSFNLKKEVSSITLSASESYSLFEIGDELDSSVKVVVNYKEGGADTIKTWSSDYVSDSDTEVLYSGVTEGGSEIYVRLENENGIVSVPTSVSETLPMGNYTLTAYVKGEESISDSQAVAVTGIPESAVEVKLDTPVTYPSNAGTVYYVFYADDADSNYIIGMVAEDTDAYLYSFEGAEGNYVGTIGWDTSKIVAEGGKTYVLRLKTSWETNTISYKKKKEIATVSLAANDSYPAFGVGEVFTHLPLEITYSDNSTTETIKDWYTTWRSDPDEYSSHREGKVTTDNGDQIYLRMEDASGTAVDLPTDSDDAVTLGTYTLKVYADSAAAPLAAKTVTLTGITDEVTEIALGGSQTFQMNAGDKRYYSFTSDTEESYSVTVEYTGEGYLYNGNLYSVEGTAVNYIGSLRSGVRRIDLASGVTYVWAAEADEDGTNGTFSVKKTQAVTDIKITAEPEVKEYIEDLDYWLSTEGMQVEVTYEDGKKDSVTIGENDSYGNSVNAGLYKKEEGEQPDGYGEDYLRYFSAGTYYLAVTVDGSDKYAQVPVQIITKSEAAKRNILSDGSDGITLKGTNGYYVCAQYTPEQDGTYRFITDCDIWNKYVYDSDEKWVDVKDIDCYECEVELTASKTYIVAVRMNRSQCMLYAEKVNEIQSVEAGTHKPELIAGVDALDVNDFYVNVSYEDTTELTLKGEESDANGNAFRYEVSDTNGNTVYDTYPGIGSYLVQAVHRTDSSIKAKEAFSVEAKALDVDSLDVLTEGQAVTLQASGSRKFYSFKPQNTGIYALKSDSGIEADFYLQGTTGLNKVGNFLSAGDTYVVMIESVPYQQQISVVYIASDGDFALKAGAAKEFAFSDGNYEEFYFTADSSGKYSVLAECLDSREAHSLFIGFSGNSEIYDYTNEDGRVYFLIQATKGQTYTIRLYKNNLTADADTACVNHRILVSYVDGKTPKSVTAVAKAGVTGIDLPYRLAGFIDMNDYVDVTVTYADGTTGAVKIGSSDGYGNWTYFNGWETDSNKDTANVTFEVMCGNASTMVTLKMGMDSSNLKSLEFNKDNELIAGEGDWDFYKVTAPESGKYYYKVSGLTDYTLYYVSLNDSSSGRIDNTLTMEKGYILGVKKSAQDVGKSYTVNITRSKTVQKVAVLTKPQSTAISGTVGDGMTATVTYTDDTTATISANDAMDAYGNLITCTAVKLTNSKTRIYLTCGDFRTSCDVDHIAITELPQLSVNQEYSVTAESAGKKSVQLSFTPAVSGTYGYGVSTVTGTDTWKMCCYDSETGTNSMYFPTALEAGKTYALDFEAQFSEAGTFTFTMYLLGGSQCADGHDPELTSYTPATCTEDGVKIWTCSRCGYKETEILPATGHDYPDEWTVDTEPTCTAAGVQIKVCKNCGDRLTEELPALGHDYPEEWTVTKAATCTEDGSQYRVCTRCGAKETEVINKLGHQYGEELTIEPTTTSNGKVYKVCERCQEELIVEILPATEVADVIEKVTQGIEDESLSNEEIVNELTSVDNQTVIDIISSGEESTPAEDTLIGKVETRITADASIGETVPAVNPEATSITAEGIKVVGAAITVAAALQEDSETGGITQEEDTVYSAQLAVTENSMQQNDDGKLCYQVDLQLNIVATKGEETTVVKEAAQLAAPVQITIPVPAEYQGRGFELYHIQNEVPVKVTYVWADVAKTKISFWAAGFSPYELRATTCGAGNHIWGTDPVITPSTCTTHGEAVYKCSVCGEEKTESLDLIDHSWEWIEDEAAGCGKTGRKHQECSVCKTTKDIDTVIPATSEHNWEWEVDKDATCEDTGLKHEECTICKATRNVDTTIPATGHDWEWKTDKEATCGATGIKHQECSVCHARQQEGTVIPATGKHNWEWVTDKEATCGATGIKHQECSVCHAKQQEGTVIPITSDHTWTTVVDKAATCGAAGSQHTECSVCHKTQGAATSIPATGRHTYGAYVTTKAATALTEGTMTRTCTVCGHSESKSIPKLTPTITLNATSIKLKTKQSTTKLQVSGLAAGDYVVSWKSSNTKIVKVTNSGKVTAQKKTGKAVLTVTLASGKTAKVNVTVQSAAVKTTKISGLSKKLTLARGKKTTLKPVITPITSVEKVTYTTSNKKVATVSSKGVITAKASGTAKITVKSGSKKFVVTVKVPKTATTAIKNVPATATVKKGKTLTLKPKLTPSKSEDKITYTSSNKKVATVTAKGKITGKKKGTAVITVKSGKIKVKCTVTVK